MPEEETFSYYNLLSTELKFKNKFNDVSNTYLNIADDDCTNSLFLSQYIATVTSNMLAKELCFDSLSPSYSDGHQKLSLNLSSDFSDLKQYMLDNYEVVTGSGNKYSITEASDGFIIDDKIKNEMLFAGDGLTISLIHKNDTNNEFIKKENETIYSYNITNNTNLATSIYRNLETLNKVYDNTKNGFNFEEIPITQIIIDTPSSSETAADLQISDINKFTGMKTLYYADKVNNVDIKKIIDSNEIITAINSMKYYRDISDGNGHIIINYNTESESNKVFDINIGINIIYGIIYGYNVDNLKDKL